jgi:hypothetical protein
MGQCCGEGIALSSLKGRARAGWAGRAPMKPVG